jgi:hypothetical protein
MKRIETIRTLGSVANSSSKNQIGPGEEIDRKMNSLDTVSPIMVWLSDQKLAPSLLTEDFYAMPQG